MFYKNENLPNPFKKTLVRSVKKKKRKESNTEDNLKKVKYSVYYYQFTDELGKTHQLSTGKKTLGEAQNEIIRRYENGTLGGFENPRMKFEDFCKPFWIWDQCPIVKEKLERQGHFTQTVCRTNRWLMDKHITPYFKSVNLNKITSEMVEKWLKELHDEKELSNPTCNSILSILRQMLDYGFRKKLIERNPCDIVRPYYVNKIHSNRLSFTDEQIKSLFKNPWDDKMSYVACLLSSQTGMRLGEIRALTREQIVDNQIVVDSSWDDKCGRKTTKNSEKRIVPITSEMRDLLLSISPDEGLIFTLNGTKPVKDTTITDVLKKEMKKNNMTYDGEKLSFHSFRKYFNTLLVSSNVEGDLIRTVLGHNSVDMTIRYTDTSRTIKDKDMIRKVVKKTGWTNPYSDEVELSLVEKVS